MSIVDTAVGLLAPHQCIVCGVEGVVMCYDCLAAAGEPPPPRCVGCRKLTKNYQTCRSCKSWLKLEHVYVATVYDGVYRELEQAFKFDLKRSAAEPMAKMMSDMLPRSNNSILCPVPTAPARIRMRGFDHANYLTKALSSQTCLTRESLLQRASNTRQLGSSRQKRIDQMGSIFTVKDGSMTHENVLLVDDVTTTGATLAACAQELRKAGVKHVSAVVFAQKI